MSNGQTVTEAPPKARMRARLVGVVVSLEVVADDGATLYPVELQPLRVPAADWPSFDIAATLAQVQARLDDQP
jgi:hypothetical protein